MKVVVKIGTSSLADTAGRVDEAMVAKVAGEVRTLMGDGHQVVVVTSGAIAVGLGHLGMERPGDLPTLQAVSAIGQVWLMRTWADAFQAIDLVAGQVLLAPLDFVHRQQYLHARQTLDRLLELGVVPVVNENDAVADDEIRFGDNDRLAALVAHLIGASLLVMLTDTAGLLTADPRRDDDASLIEEILEVDAELERFATSGGSTRGSGGMASKLAAAKIAAWSGVRAVIAAASRENVLAEAVAGAAGVGTVIHPHERRLSARKLWIAFAVRASGRVIVDDGARSALVSRGRSLLPAGVVGVEGEFDAGDAVEIALKGGPVFAKGLVRQSSAAVSTWAGRRTADLPADADPEIVHRDDMVILPG